MRTVLSLLVASFVFAFFVPFAHASFLTIDKDGKIIEKVLATEAENTNGTMKVIKLAESMVNTPPAVSLRKDNGSVQMVVTNTDGTKELHVPKKTDTLVEIEERPETQKIAIGVVGDQFFVREKNYTARTSYPIKIDAQSAHLSATAEGGDMLLTILPEEAAEATLRSGYVSKITDNTMELLENDGKLQYKISGEKIFSLLHVYDYTVPVDTFVSVSDGSITKIDSSTWFRFMNFLVG